MTTRRGFLGRLAGLAALAALPSPAEPQLPPPPEPEPEPALCEACEGEGVVFTLVERSAGVASWDGGYLPLAPRDTIVCDTCKRCGGTGRRP